MSIEPLTEARGRALKAAVCQPHLNSLGAQANGIDGDEYLRYKNIRRSEDYHQWCERQAWLWRQSVDLEREECASIADITHVPNDGVRTKRKIASLIRARGESQ